MNLRPFLIAFALLLVGCRSQAFNPISMSHQEQRIIEAFLYEKCGPSTHGPAGGLAWNKETGQWGLACDTTGTGTTFFHLP